MCLFVCGCVYVGLFTEYPAQSLSYQCVGVFVLVYSQSILPIVCSFIVCLCVGVFVLIYSLSILPKACGTSVCLFVCGCVRVGLFTEYPAQSLWYQCVSICVWVCSCWFIHRVSCPKLVVPVCVYLCVGVFVLVYSQSILPKAYGTSVCLFVCGCVRVGLFTEYPAHSL